MSKKRYIKDFILYKINYISQQLCIITSFSLAELKTALLRFSYFFSQLKNLLVARVHAMPTEVSK